MDSNFLIAINQSNYLNNLGNNSITIHYSIYDRIIFAVFIVISLRIACYYIKKGWKNIKR